MKDDVVEHRKARRLVEAQVGPLRTDREVQIADAGLARGQALGFALGFVEGMRHVFDEVRRQSRR